MQAHCLAFLLIAILVAGNDDAKKAVEKDLAAMQGEWQVRWLENNGLKGEYENGIIYTIRGNKLYYRDRPLFSLKIDPTCTPKLLDVTGLGKTEDDRRTSEGLYKIEGDTLTWCYSLKEGEVRERPLTFDSAKGTGVFAWHMVRPKTR